MTDGKRLSRRQLREQGKISVRPADGVDISETTELRLRRPSRKEMREARKGETGALPAVKEATEESALEQKQPERLSVFERFTEEDNKNNKEVVADEVKADDDELAKHDEPAVDDKSQDKSDDKSDDKLGDKSQDKSDDKLGEEEKPEENAEDTGNVTMRDRLLAMTRRQKADESSEDKPEEDKPEEVHADISRTSVMPADADLEAEELGQLVAPHEKADEPEADASVADESKEMEHYEDDAPLNPRRTILNYILLILIAILAGLLLGLLINSAFFSASSELVPAVPSVTELLL